MQMLLQCTTTPESTAIGSKVFVLLVLLFFTISGSFKPLELCKCQFLTRGAQTFECHQNR